MSRKTQRNPPKQLNPPKDAKTAKDDGDDSDDVIIPEVVDQQQLVNQHTIQTFVDQNKEGELKTFLNTVVDYNERRLSVLREHAEKHPDAIEMRKSRISRRNQYLILLSLTCILLLTMPFVNLAVAGIFGTISTLIVCGILVNARERELDLQGFIRLINIVIGSNKEK